MRLTLLLTTRLLLPLLGLPLGAAAQASAPSVAPVAVAKLPAAARSPAAADSLTGPASDKYHRGAIGRFFFGTHYRPTWAMPVTAPVFRPAQLLGGLKAVREGGSMQTLNLRLLAPDGRQYVLRSVDKDLARALPADKRKSLKARILQDQTAAVFPYGALVAAELAQAVKVYHATPVLYRVPSDENVLGEFQEGFAGKLVFLEERPDGNWTGQRSFGGSAEVVSSRTMLRQRYGSPEATIRPPRLDMNGPAPARAYLRARLLDILLADWSRREDQWRWARTDAPPAENGTVRYRAIPRDRDHAFSRYSDGLLPGIAVLFNSKIVTFGPKIGRIAPYLKTAGPLDQVLLSWLSKADFEAEADSVKRYLTDGALDRALTRLPENVQRLNGRRLRQNLQRRRDQLPAAARALYAALSREVVLPGTDGPDEYTFAAGANGGLSLTWVSHTDSTGRGGASTYRRTFTKAETKRLYVYALGGDDRLTLTGPLPKEAPAVEFFDGAGNDQAWRTGQTEMPRWFRIRASGDVNRFDALPEWARKPAKNTSARDFDAAGFLLRHRL